MIPDRKKPRELFSDVATQDERRTIAPKQGGAKNAQSIDYVNAVHYALAGCKKTPTRRMVHDGKLALAIQPNKYFEDEKEMTEWLSVNMPQGKVIKTWKVEMLACEVVMPRKK